MIHENLVPKLKSIALEQRILTVKMAQMHGPLHIGGDLSAADIFTVVFQHEMHKTLNDLKNPDRDRFILSKGHAGGALYIAMALAGYFTQEELFDTYQEFESRFALHPCKASLPMLESSSGSLGHGLPLCVGISLAAKLDKRDYRTYCLIGDGELAEGSMWEAIMAAAQFKLDNVIAIVDFNRLTLDGFTEDIMNVDPLTDKFRAFNWHVVEADGNSIESLLLAFSACKSDKSGKPHVIIAHTTKGYGISYMENDPIYHSATLTEEVADQAIAELRTRFTEETQ